MKAATLQKNIFLLVIAVLILYAFVTFFSALESQECIKYTCGVSSPYCAWGDPGRVPLCPALDSGSSVCWKLIDCVVERNTCVIVTDPDYQNCADCVQDCNGLNTTCILKCANRFLT